MKIKNCGEKIAGFKNAFMNIGIGHTATGVGQNIKRKLRFMI